MRTLFALIASAGLVGCVGSVDNGDPIIDDGSGTPDTDNPTKADLTPAKKLFDDNVYSVLAAKCGSTTCHAQAGTGGTVTKFVATDKADGWSVATNFGALVSNYTTSAPVLGYPDSGHKGIAYTPAEKDKITQWLAKELELRSGQPTTPTGPQVETLSQAADRVMSKFAGCMTIENFNAANMANAWGGLQAQNNQQCEDCHNNGGEGFVASRQAPLMFPAISGKKMYFLQYFTVDLTKGAPEAKVIINKVSFQGVARGQDPHREHPQFNPDTNQGITALTTFFNTTTAKAALPQGDPAFCAPKPLANF
jgi:cytochrome c553